MCFFKTYSYNIFNKGVLMSRSKYNTKGQSESSNFISQTTAAILSKSGVIDYCLSLLKSLLEYWKR